jgi:hypothetical protein
MVAVTGAVLASAAQFQPVVVPEFVGGVFPSAAFKQPGFFEAARGCLEQTKLGKHPEAAQNLQQDCLATFMRDHGASTQAIAFMRLAPVPAAISEMREYGPVAVVHASMMWADGSDGWALVGKSGELIPLWEPPQIDQSSKYVEFKSHHPGVSVWSDALSWPRAPASASAGGGLAFAFALKTCHACATLGTADVIYRFNEAGRLKSVDLLRITK